MRACVSVSTRGGCGVCECVCVGGGQREEQETNPKASVVQAALSVCLSCPQSQG